MHIYTKSTVVRRLVMSIVMLVIVLTSSFFALPDILALRLSGTIAFFIVSYTVGIFVVTRSIYTARTYFDKSNRRFSKLYDLIYKQATRLLNEQSAITLEGNGETHEIFEIEKKDGDLNFCHRKVEAVFDSENMRSTFEFSNTYFSLSEDRRFMTRLNHFSIEGIGEPIVRQLPNAQERFAEELSEMPEATYTPDLEELLNVSEIMKNWRKKE